MPENFFKKFFHQILAKLFYLAFRIGGKKYFNYKGSNFEAYFMYLKNYSNT